MRTYLGVYKWWLSLLISAVLLTGCGGGSGTTSTSISGTAATGAALAGTIDLVDANGVTRTVTIGANGAFEVDTTSLAAPFILRATGSGNDAGIVLYSMADGVTGIFNITPLTQLAVELFRQGIAAGTPADLGALFNNWKVQGTPADLATLQASLLQAQARINANLAQQFTDAGLTPADFDFLRTAFVPNQRGIDAVLDLISGLTIAGNTITMNVGGNPFNFNININIAGFTIGGGNAGGGGGGAGVLTCDTSQFQPNSVHAASAQELADFDGNYTGDIYTDDGAGNSTRSDGSAAFGANGNLTLNNQAKTATSICVDNEAGVYGAVLYVHFADGHVDLFANGTFSGSVVAPAGGGAGGTSTAPALDLSKCELQPNNNYLCTPDAIASFGPYTISNTGTATTCTISYNGSGTMDFLGGGKSASLPVAQFAVARYPSGGLANVLLTSGRMSFHVGASNQIDYVRYWEPNYASSVTCLDVNNQ